MLVTGVLFFVGSGPAVARRVGRGWVALTILSGVAAAVLSLLRNLDRLPDDTLFWVSKFLTVACFFLSMNVILWRNAKRVRS
jgi:hypothetical protein